MDTPQYYIDLLTHMSVNKNGKKVAPHKAILLLSIIDMIESGEITSPLIQLTDKLNDTFMTVWRVNVPKSSSFSPKLSYPFYHLSSSPFWELVKSPNHIGQTEYSSLTSLKRDYTAAIMDVGLFRIMKDLHAREEIKTLLKSTYLSTPDGATTNTLSIATLVAIICAVA